MSNADAQSHRSIGEVLSLLQEEYPDVTISKIRFLESQGLVAPERTASGFRKFYDSDIQRLRWILCKQTDQFLPLKVIKKMLDEGADVSIMGESEPQQTLWPMDPGSGADPATSAGDVGAAGPGEAPAAVAHAVPTGLVDSDVEPPGRTGGDQGDRGVERSGPSVDGPDEITADDAARDRRGSTRKERRRSDRGRKPSPTHPSIVGRTIVDAQAVKASDDVTDRNGGDDSDVVPTTSATAEGADPTGEDPTAVAAGRRPRGIMTPADIVAALQEDPRPAGGQRDPSRRGGSHDPRSSDARSSDTIRVRQFSVEDLTSTRGREDFLSAEELCEMFDIEPSFLDELEKFGLIAPRRYGGTTSYDGSDTEIIAVSVRYAAMGVEPRHLRMYKIAAEREAGFVEQLVLPILKQRNPAAKQNAAERSSQLASMGDELHNLILRRHLRNLLDNR